MNRFWIYQRERFPLLSHGVVIAVFSASAIAFSAFARHAAFPTLLVLAAGFVSSLIFFMQLRIADEWKDAADDRRYRPYRPVPRGLVTLRELTAIGIAGSVVQLAIAIVVSPHLVPLLFVVWTYFALMSREFFVSGWLRARPVAYICSHMVIVPLIDGYVSGFDWLAAGATAPHALGWFLAVTFCNGVVVEIGRKLRAPRDEEHGVETYTALWGVERATQVWCVAIGSTALLAIVAAAHVGLARVDAPVFAIGFCAAIGCAIIFMRRPLAAMAKRIEIATAAWTISMYATLGLLPFVLRGAL